MVAVDAPGHGDSGHDDASLEQGAALLTATGGAGTYVGYSMGGRLALHAAVYHPSLVERLVLIGATPGIEDDADRAARRASDDALAGHLEDVGLEQFLDEWLAQPLFSGLSTAAADLPDRRRNRPDGLAASLRHAGTGTQRPLWDRLPVIDCPVLLLVGEQDSKFGEIADRMCARFPDASLATIEGAGHTVHLEQPAVTAAVLIDWLSTHPPRASPTAAVTP